MARRRLIRARVGRARLARGLDPSQRNYTANIRRQLDVITKNIEAVIFNLEDALPEAIEFALQPAFELSQTYVPVRTGDLKSSGYLESRKVRGKTVTEIGYARGGTPNYGVFVHENLEAAHSPPTQAKFLERALRERGNQVGPRIVEFLRDNIGA